MLCFSTLCYSTTQHTGANDRVVFFVIAEQPLLGSFAWMALLLKVVQGDDIKLNSSLKGKLVNMTTLYSRKWYIGTFFIYTEHPRMYIDPTNQCLSSGCKSSLRGKTQTKNKLGKDTTHHRSVDELGAGVITSLGIDYILHRHILSRVLDPVGE